MFPFVRPHSIISAMVEMDDETWTKDKQEGNPDDDSVGIL